MHPLLVVGSLAFDTITTPHGTVERVLGGSANYFSVAASFHAPVRLVGIVGADYPQEHFDWLAERHIDASGVERRGERTFNWTGKYEGDMGEAKTLEVNLEAFGDFLPTIPEAFRDTPYVFLANGSPRTQKHVCAQLDRPRFVVADTMNLWIETQRQDLLDLLKRIDGLVLNDTEARMLTATDSTVAAGRRILDLGPWLVVIKKGEHGALALTKDAALTCPAYPLETVVDPTGAGDSFAGGFMSYLALVDDLSLTAFKKALKYGTVVSSYNVERFGMERLKSLTRGDFERRLSAFEQML